MTDIVLMQQVDHLFVARLDRQRILAHSSMSHAPAQAVGVLVPYHTYVYASLLTISTESSLTRTVTRFRANVNDCRTSAWLGI